VSLAIREAAGDADLATYATIVNAASPEDPTSVEELRWSDATYPGGLRILADLDGRTVGAASVGRIYVHPPAFPYQWGSLDVVADARRQGVGTALLTRISARAAADGKIGLHIPASASRPFAVEFLLHRGFEEHERMRALRLDLTGLAPPAVEPPAGVTITTLAARPDLVTGVHQVALEAFMDIPGGDEPMTVGDLAEFRTRDVDRDSIPADAFFVAQDAATGRVIGYSSLMLTPGSTTSAWYDMTAVLRAWRRRGVAVALKRATIGWAIAHGLVALDTGNDVENAPMRAVNAKLGFRPLPDLLTLRGPLFGGMMTP
jgi:GNAT superfamily N-acetyltransferase